MKELLFGEIVQQKFHSSEFLQNAIKSIVLLVPVEMLQAAPVEMLQAALHFSSLEC